MKKLLATLVHIIFPPYCVICGRLLPLSRWNEMLCKECHADIPYIKGETCETCGRHSVGGVTCPSCYSYSYAFTKGIAAFSYETVKKGIHRFKYEGVGKDGEAFGVLMGDFLMAKHAEWLTEVDYMTAVPLHPKKQRERGFNQGELLCVSLAKKTGLEYRSGILQRRKNTVPQSALNAKKRRENLRDGFVSEDVSGHTILLIDDIFTTGTTLHECCRALYRRGAKEVRVFSLSVTDTPEH